MDVQWDKDFIPPYMGPLTHSVVEIRIQCKSGVSDRESGCFNEPLEMQSHECPDVLGDVLINNNEDNNLNIVSRKCIIEHA